MNVSVSAKLVESFAETHQTHLQLTGESLQIDSQLVIQLCFGYLEQNL
jgi:hypothetical protein